MQIIGITGRSGCGKSTLTDSIRAAGFRCVDADQVAREVLLPGSPCIVQLQQEFGDVFDQGGFDFALLRFIGQTKKIETVRVFQ